MSTSEIAARIIGLDPDFRRQPKTQRFCALCQKDIRPEAEARVIWTTSQIDHAVHPDETNLVPIKEYNWLLIGSDCARKIGLEWSRPEAEG